MGTDTAEKNKETENPTSTPFSERQPQDKQWQGGGSVLANTSNLTPEHLHLCCKVMFFIVFALPY